MKSERKKLSAACEDGCTWRSYGSVIQNENAFVIKTYTKEHKCFRSLTNRQATTEWIANEFLEKIRVKPAMEVKDMLSMLKDKYTLTASMSQCYRGKWKALNILRWSL